LHAVANGLPTWKKPKAYFNREKYIFIRQAAKAEKRGLRLICEQKRLI
jgi:hypothetical protein